MRATNRRRPLRRARVEPPPDVDLVKLADLASYRGSPEHKDTFSAAGVPRFRSDASICPRELDASETPTEWLREAIRAGAIGGPWEGEFPRYAWIRNEHGGFEARLTNREVGQYKGYPLEPSEVPRWLI